MVSLWSVSRVVTSCLTPAVLCVLCVFPPGHSAVVVGDNMVVFGGAEGALRTNSVAMFSLSSRKWRQFGGRGTIPAARSCTFACV